MLKTCSAHFKKMIVLYVLMGSVVQFLNSYGIKLFQEILDQAVYTRNFNEIIAPIILYGALLAAATLLHYLIEYPQTHLSTGILEKLKIMALTKVSKIDYASYQNFGTGETIKMIDNGAEAGMNIIHSFYLKLFHELLPTIIFSLFFISLYNMKMMAIIAIGYILLFLFNHILLRMLYRIKSSLLERQETMSRFSIRGFMELVVFRLNKRYKQEIERLNRTAQDIVTKSTHIQMIHEAFFALFALFVNIIKVFVLIYGIQDVIAGKSTIGVVIAVLLFIDQVYTPIAIFNVLFVDYKLNRVTYARMERFLQAPEDRNLDQGIELNGFKGNIDFYQVQFDYDTTSILNNVTFSIKQGETVAIIGLSGSGKSTLVKLMLGLLKKKSGQILIDDVDIDRIKLNHLYDHVSYISQESPIFDATIRENIDLGHRLTDEQIIAILETVHLKKKVLRLPEQLDTRVGERGMKLSGGERQRLAFARMFAQQRELVILDEPVSALDHITENSIMEHLIKVCRDKTIIVVAHRLGTIKDADRILLMKNGSLVDEGCFEELLKRSEYFKQLWEKERNRAS